MEMEGVLLTLPFNNQICEHTVTALVSQEVPVDEGASPIAQTKSYGGINPKPKAKNKVQDRELRGSEQRRSHPPEAQQTGSEGEPRTAGASGHLGTAASARQGLLSTCALYSTAGRGWGWGAFVT